MESLNLQIWGFLSNCVAAEADTIFKGADDLQGIEAWRRIIRYIDHGKSIKLEQMRNEMKTVHLRPIKSLENVAIGIAEFELRLKEYGELGGVIPDDDEKKTDLLNLLPGALRESLLWRATDPGPYIKFRDMVRSQAARSLLQQQKLPLHRIEEGSRDVDDREFGGDEDDRDVETMTRSELIAYVKRGEQGARGRSRGAVGGQRRERDG